MAKKHPHGKHSLLCAFLLFVLCNSLASSQENDACDYRYLTINTYDDLDAVNISCLEVNGDCNVYFSPPGNGCYEDSLTFVGTIPQGKTKAIKTELPYGAALCSNIQTSVQVGDDFTAIAQLPRATQSGKMFHTSFKNLQDDKTYKCGVSALATPANIKYSLVSTDTDTEMLVDKYQTEDITFDVKIDAPNTLKIVSDAPVIVSCQETTNDEPQLIVLEPISSQAQLIVSPSYGYVQFTIANCATNEIITDSSSVTWVASVYSYIDLTSCNHEFYPNDNSIETFSWCATVITPNDIETCVSVLGYDSAFNIIGVGLPESKLTSRLVNYPYQQIQYYFSFSATSCLSDSGEETDELKLKWLPGPEKSVVAGAQTAISIDKYDSVMCLNPVFLLFHGDGNTFVSFRSGYQPDELWTPFFESEDCENSPTLAPTLPPTRAPSKAVRPSFAMGSVNALLAVCSYFVLGS